MSGRNRRWDRHGPGHVHEQGIGAGRGDGAARDPAARRNGGTGPDRAPLPERVRERGEARGRHRSRLRAALRRGGSRDQGPPRRSREGGPGRRRFPVGRPDGDRGSATVWAAVAAAALCAVFAAVFLMAKVTVARHRAGGAADLAALAAADHALEGTRAACGLAERVAVAQGARIVRCVVQGEFADLTAEVRAGPFAPRVRSRAGPAEAVPPTGREAIGSVVPHHRPEPA
ncbi:Rv3654c family TadE-like protein [Streptomyces pactum]|uniref:Rv3654c family TadE-like protein n=1 Tax=Streptomyces pactum TaxID=68249 RepID=UPI0036FF8BAE